MDTLLVALPLNGAENAPILPVPSNDVPVLNPVVVPVDVK